MSYRSQLAIYDKAWQETHVEPGGDFDPVPDGKYQARVEKVEIVESKAGNLMLKWELVIENGEYVGRHIWKYNGIEKEEHIQWLKKDLLTAGLELELLSMLEDNLEQLLDRVLEITVKTKNEFQNVYFNKLVSQQQRNWPPNNENDLPF